MGAAPCCLAEEGNVVCLETEGARGDGYGKNRRVRLSVEEKGVKQITFRQPEGSPIIRSATLLGGLKRSSSDTEVGKIKKSREKMMSSAAQDLPEGGQQAASLAWMLSPRAASSVSAHQLLRFHEQIAKCAALVGARVLTNEASFGVLVGPAVEHRGMNDADAMLRFGQLLCRWAVSHRLGIRIGVHMGVIQTVVLPDLVGQCDGTSSPLASKVAYFGSAMAQAVQLATSAEKECVVHLSSNIKERLDAYRLVSLTVTQYKNSYHLEPTTPMDNYHQSRSSRSKARQSQQRMVLDITMPVSKQDSEMMDFEDFIKYLQDHDVDVSKFGKGSAKTIDEFYQSVVKEQKEFLEVGADGKLLRHVDLVRISLRIRDDKNKLRELRLQSAATSGGGLHFRDQPLAFVLRPGEQWVDATTRGLLQKLGLSEKAQKACLGMDQASYHLTEDRSLSERIPGVATLYRAHNIIMNVRDREMKDLQDIGLPEGVTFTKPDDGLERTFNWSSIAGNDKEEQLMSMLQNNGVDVTEFAPQAFGELYDEIYERGISTIEVVKGEVVRTIRVMKVWVRAQVLNVDHFLVVKAKWQKGQFDEATKGTPVSMRMSTEQDWQDAVEDALFSRLGITRDFQNRYLSVIVSSHRVNEEMKYSASYPGIKTLYLINEVMVEVEDSNQAACTLIGLPFGTDFTYCRREVLGQGPQNEDTVVTHWCWNHAEEAAWGTEMAVERAKTMESNKSYSHMTEGGNTLSERCYPILPEEEDEGVDQITRIKSFVSEQELFKRRVPKTLSLKPMDEAKQQEHAAASILATCMAGKKPNWVIARNIVKRIRDPGYSCKDFYEDLVAAFPELQLYRVSLDSEAALEDLVTSGRTSDDEYQRTIGALFAVFWLIRLDMGGKESFCFGVTSDMWAPRTIETGNWTSRHMPELPKRQAFFDEADWESIGRLVEDAGLLSWRGDDPAVSEDHVLAMLVLMVIHDIMKLTPLLPVVAKSVGEFAGYKTGETINDHDEALSYILVHHPELLPSFSGLSKPQRELIRFAHCKIEYNMGWLVQAEAPPGALFRTFRQVALTGKFTIMHVAFYLMHWFADLAGAEPCPLEGCEKFVLKFPLKVLCRFLESFSVVQTLASKTETEVLEDYLLSCWDRHEPSLGPRPTGVGAVAKLRLVLMSQGDTQDILSSFASLSPEDAEILCQEMACTGCKGQQYTSDDNAGTTAHNAGPAMLIYYGPALLQKAGRTYAKGAMIVLAEVYRQAREFWPLQEAAANESVTVRIDAIKELEVSQIVRPDAGQVYVLTKTSGKDAAVKLLSSSDLQGVDWDKTKILAFGATRGAARGRRPSMNMGMNVSGFLPRAAGRLSVFSTIRGLWA